jgi:hypothetical protein
VHKAHQVFKAASREGRGLTTPVFSMLWVSANGQCQRPVSEKSTFSQLGE